MEMILPLWEAPTFTGKKKYKAMEEQTLTNPHTIYEDYIAISRYARYLPELKRREVWGETVARYVDFFTDRFDL